MTFSNWIEPYKTNEADKATHLLLNGGKLKIPPELELEFIKIYSLYLNQEKMFVVERRPEVFKYMIDIDILDEEYWGKEKVMTLVRFVQRIIFCFYSIDMNVICCMSPPANKKGKVKTGVHLIWPKHFIIAQDALVLREAILQKINELDFSPSNSWEDVFDEIVYIRNGFRMVGSDKLDPDSRLPENREYKLQFILDSKGEERQIYQKRLEENNYSLIQDTSIRLTPLENIKTTVEIKRLPEWFKMPEHRTIKRNSKKVSIACVEYTVLTKTLNTILPSCYKDISIKKIEQYPNGNFLLIPGSRYCLNIAKNHRSCGIYFIAKPEGIIQKCLCPCNNLNGRLNGLCKDFTSECFPFTPEIKKKLFPNVEAKTEAKRRLNLTKKQTRDKYFKNHEKFCDNLLSQF